MNKYLVYFRKNIEFSDIISKYLKLVELFKRSRLIHLLSERLILMFSWNILFSNAVIDYLAQHFRIGYKSLHIIMGQKKFFKVLNNP